MEKIYSCTGAERERLGRCIAGLALQSSGTNAAKAVSANHLYTFAKALESSASQAASLEDMGFGEGDMIVLSVEGALQPVMPNYILPLHIMASSV